MDAAICLYFRVLPEWTTSGFVFRTLWRLRDEQKNSVTLTSAYTAAGWLGRLCWLCRTRAHAPPADDRLTGLAVPREEHARAPHTDKLVCGAQEYLRADATSTVTAGVSGTNGGTGRRQTRRETNESTRRGDSISHRAVEAKYPVQPLCCCVTRPIVRSGTGGRALCGSPLLIAHPFACYTGGGRTPPRGAVVGVVSLAHKLISPLSPVEYVIRTAYLFRRVQKKR